VSQYIDIIYVSEHNAFILRSSATDWLNKSHSTGDEYCTNKAFKYKYIKMNLIEFITYAQG